MSVYNCEKCNFITENKKDYCQGMAIRLTLNVKKSLTFYLTNLFKYVII